MQHSPLRSYGRKKARKLREQTKQAYEAVLPLVACDVQDLFPTTEDVWLEIGFGGGEHLLAQLKHNPQVKFIGCEPFLNGVAKLLTHLPEEDYPRIKIWQDDVRLLLHHVPNDYFSHAFILFPDPWPKARHHRRRLITNEFIKVLVTKLKKGARLHVASDDASYVEQIQDVLYAHPSLTLVNGPSSADPETWTDRPSDWPPTRYEQKALSAGKKCAYMKFRKN